MRWAHALCVYSGQLRDRALDAWRGSRPGPRLQRHDQADSMVDEPGKSGGNGPLAETV